MQKKIIKENNKLLEYLEFNNISIKRLLEEILNKKIYSIKYLGSDKLKQIPEYNFELIKLNIVLEDDKNYDVFLRLIDKYKIKETMFCYWYFCQEKFNVNKSNQFRSYSPKANIIEYKNISFSKKFNIQLLNKNNRIWRNSDIHFVELENYIQCVLKKRQVNSIKVHKIHEILFIGVI